MSRFRRFLNAPVLIISLLAIPLLAEIASIAAQKGGFTRHELAYYLDQNLLNFVRPGLKIKITSATIQNAQITVRFTLTDPRGVPLDREGTFTPGAISTSFIAAYIPKGEKQYTAYTTRLQTSTVTSNSAVQAGTDSGGTYTKNADGDYTYAFRTTVPATFDPTLTHSIGMYATRDLREFDLGRQYDNDVFTFVPNGSPVTVVRDVVRTENCNQCHDPLALHGGSRRKTELCILCHQPQTTDPDTGNTVDFKVMIHKIHMGEDLPSVKAGKPYRIIGNNQSDHNFSNVAFPNDVRNCEVCHKTATQGLNYLNPSRAACGSCHDDVNFASGSKHLDLPQVSDNLCANCHIPQGELEFDASIKGAHTIPSLSAQLPGVNFTIVKVENTAPGQKPTVSFTVKDRAGNVLDAAPMARLRLVLAGPTTDYANHWQENAVGATRSGDQYLYTFTNAIPGDAKGTYVVGIEGFRNITLNPGTTRAMPNVRDVGMNQVTYFSVDGSRVVPRRQVVALSTCTTCHGSPFISAHGTARRSTEYCVICHHANFTDASQRPRPELMPAESLHFKTMIHKVHTGEELATDFTVYDVGTAVNFNELRFPGDRRNCDKCHVNDSYQLPLPDGVLPSQSPRGWIKPTTEPIAAACLACHTQKPAAAHASLMTSPTLGESCEVCHGRTADFALDRVHAR